MNEYNFIHRRLPETDKELFFGPLTDQDEFIEFDDGYTWLDILVEIGMFSSKSEARKNIKNLPVDIEIEPGFKDVYLGKKKTRVTVLNWFEA